MRRRISFIHDCSECCPRCYGSGEGKTERSLCEECGGSGNLFDLGESEIVITLSWENLDMTDAEIIEGPEECEECGQDFLSIALEEVWSKS